MRCGSPLSAMGTVDGESTPSTSKATADAGKYRNLFDSSTDRFQSMLSANGTSLSSAGRVVELQLDGSSVATHGRAVCESCGPLATAFATVASRRGRTHSSVRPSAARIRSVLSRSVHKIIGEHSRQMEGVRRTAVSAWRGAMAENIAASASTRSRTAVAGLGEKRASAQVTGAAVKVISG